MKLVYMQWLITLIFLVLLIIDVVDGQAVKIATTFCLAVSMIAFAWGLNSPRQRIWFIVLYSFGLLAIAGFIYRMVVHYQTV